MPFFLSSSGVTGLDDLGSFPMTTAVQTLLDHFEALSEAERHEAVVEILRRVSSPPALPDEALVAAADEVFRELDVREAAESLPWARRGVAGRSGDGRQGPPRPGAERAGRATGSRPRHARRAYDQRAGLAVRGCRSGTVSPGRRVRRTEPRDGSADQAGPQAGGPVCGPGGVRRGCGSSLAGALRPAGPPNHALQRTRPAAAPSGMTEAFPRRAGRRVPAEDGGRIGEPR